MSSGATSVGFADLRAALLRLLDAAETQFGPSVDLAADHYWLLELSELFAVDSTPTVNAGQLSDDVASLGEILARADGETILWHDLQHVTGILLRLASLDLPANEASGVN